MAASFKRGAPPACGLSASSQAISRYPASQPRSLGGTSPSASSHAAAVSIAFVGATWAQERKAGAGSRRRGRRRARRLPLAASLADATDSDFSKFDALSAALEIAERLEDYKEAAKLRDLLASLESESPVKALSWRRQKRTSDAKRTALARGAETADRRLEAVQQLQDLASPPLPAPGALDALHAVLRAVGGVDEEGFMMEAVEEALWAVWLQSGDAEIDELLRKGMSLLGRNKFKAAATAFTEVIDRAPQFAEAWNKRATTYYCMGQYQKSIDDCMKVLELCPRHFGCLSGLGMCHASLRNIKEALKWTKEALEVHPGLQSAKMFVDNTTVQGILTEHLSPQVDDVVNAFQAGAEVPLLSSDDVSSTWDVHRVAMPEGSPGAHVYFFRVDYHNTSTTSRSVRSLARFYVLDLEGGNTFPFTRVTEPGPAQFTLNPRERYKFCWVLILSKPLRRMAGGTLFEFLDEESSGFPTAGLEVLSPGDAQQVTQSKLEQLGQGYYFTGQLDLRQL